MSKLQGAWTTPPDVHHVAKVLAELLSDQYGREITITLTPKSEEQLAAERGG